jgi:hypothetical protein
MPSQSTLFGAAGAHHIMAELLRRSYIAALAPEGVPAVDILVTDVEGARLCSIQVKTRRDIGSDGSWHMKEKHENTRSDRLFYCFMDFGKDADSRPVVHVLPSTRVAEVLFTVHRKWLANPGKNGNPTKMVRCDGYSQIILAPLVREFLPMAKTRPHHLLPMTNKGGPSLARHFRSRLRAGVATSRSTVSERYSN